MKEEVMEIEANNLDVIEKELEKENFAKDSKKFWYSNLVLGLILLMYMSNQWQRFCKFVADARFECGILVRGQEGGDLPDKGLNQGLEQRGVRYFGGPRLHGDVLGAGALHGKRFYNSRAFCPTA